MTELYAIDGERPETLTEVVSRRLRGQLAERRIKHTEVQELTGWGKTTVWRKINGRSALDTDDLDKLWRLFKISPVLLLTGQPDNQPGPEGPGGGHRVGKPTDLRAAKRRTAHITYLPQAG